MSFDEIWRLPGAALDRDRITEVARELAREAGMEVYFDRAMTGVDNIDEVADLSDLEREDPGHLQVEFELRRNLVETTISKISPDRTEADREALRQELTDLAAFETLTGSEFFGIAIDFWDAEGTAPPRIEVYSNHFDNQDLWSAALVLFYALCTRLAATPLETSADDVLDDD